MNAAEKKAAALPPTLTVPMILFFLPGLFCGDPHPGGRSRSTTGIDQASRGKPLPAAARPCGAATRWRGLEDFAMVRASFPPLWPDPVAPTEPVGARRPPLGAALAGSQSRAAPRGRGARRAGAGAGGGRRRQDAGADDPHRPSHRPGRARPRNPRRHLHQQGGARNARAGRTLTGVADGLRGSARSTRSARKCCAAMPNWSASSRISPFSIRTISCACSSSC